MTCIASGSPQPTLQWFKDGAPLVDETGSVLVFEEVSLSSRGIYHCTATNEEGVAVSAQVVLNVLNIRQYLIPALVSFSDLEALVSQFIEQLNSQAAGIEVTGLMSSEIFIYSIELHGSPDRVSSNR